MYFNVNRGTYKETFNPYRIKNLEYNILPKQLNI